MHRIFHVQRQGDGFGLPFQHPGGIDRDRAQNTATCFLSFGPCRFRRPASRLHSGLECEYLIDYNLKHEEKINHNSEKLAFLSNLLRLRKLAL